MSTIFYQIDPSAASEEPAPPTPTQSSGRTQRFPIVTERENTQIPYETFGKLPLPTLVEIVRIRGPGQSDIDQQVHFPTDSSYADGCFASAPSLSLDAYKWIVDPDHSRTPESVVDDLRKGATSYVVDKTKGPLSIWFLRKLNNPRP